MRTPDLGARTVATALRGTAARALGAGIARAGQIAPGLAISSALLSGPPAIAVAEAGTDASMLVVGACGAGGFASLLLGSVSRYAAVHSACPVVVVREENVAVHGEIAVGVRDLDDATEALAFAFEEAALRGAGLVAIHAWFWLPSALERRHSDTARTAADWQRVQAAAAEQLDLVLAGWQEKYPAVRIRQDVVHARPGQVLASYSGRTDLLVLGRHANARHPGSGGPVRNAVLGHARGPVAVIPSNV